MSPVWAPCALGWQSSPPTATDVPATASAARANSVAGTQITTSAAEAIAGETPPAIACKTARESLVPFIFQLPATSGRMPGVMRNPPGAAKCVVPDYQKRATKQSTLALKNAI